jgi:hypothetical protein
MKCTEPLCPNDGKWCWCDPATDQHYYLLSEHLKTLIRHKIDGKKLESHNDIPDDLRGKLLAHRRGIVVKRADKGTI